VEVVAGVDLGGTAINYTLITRDEKFLIEGLCEHPALSKQGPDICLQQIEDGLKIAADLAQIPLTDIVAIGLDTPGPASAAGQLSAKGSTNFVHANWAGFDIREGLARKLGKPVSYLNDGNAGALWGHFTIFGANSKETSVSIVIGTGLGGGVIIDGNVVKGRKGFGGELGHVLIPYQSIPGIEGLKPQCNCGRLGDLESVCSLTAIEKTFLPYFLPKYPGHELASVDRSKAAKMVRGMADRGDDVPRYLPRPGPRHRPVPRRNGEHVRSRRADHRRRRARGQRSLPEMVYRTGSGGHANTTRRTGRYPDLRDAERRYRRRPRRRHRSAKAGP
jgi:glucokinase